MRNLCPRYWPSNWQSWTTDKMSQQFSSNFPMHHCIIWDILSPGRKWDILSDGTICLPRNAIGTICPWDKMSPNQTQTVNPLQFIVWDIWQSKVHLESNFLFSPSHLFLKFSKWSIWWPLKYVEPSYCSFWAHHCLVQILFFSPVCLQCSLILLPVPVGGFFQVVVVACQHLSLNVW